MEEKALTYFCTRGSTERPVLVSVWSHLAYPTRVCQQRRFKALHSSLSRGPLRLISRFYDTSDIESRVMIASEDIESRVETGVDA